MIEDAVDFPILRTSPRDWKYVSEGGATIVFSYMGPSHFLFSGNVLRLRKSVIFAGAHSGSFTDKDEHPLVSCQDLIKFQNDVVGRLVPQEYLPNLQVVRVSRPWLEALYSAHDSQRPPARRAKDGVDPYQETAILATDLISGEELAVEIKPKWAFLPSPTHLSAETVILKTKTCRYCMHKVFKARESRFTLHNSYCPLDLFSGDSARVEKALSDLWDTWTSTRGTGNNLRIFRNGELFSPSNIATAGLFAGCDREPLCMRAQFVRTVSPLLLETPVLHLIKTHQRNLDVLDIEGLMRLCAVARPNCPSWHRSEPEPLLDEWTKFMDKYLTSHQAMDHNNPNPADLRYYLLAYLLSATLKDCSIILRPCHSKTKPVAVIDLDIKKMDKMPEWTKMDEEIVRHYREVGNSCGDR